MDKSRFSERKTGSLLRIHHHGEEWAFLPDRLPPQWEFPTRLWPQLVEAKEQLATLNGIGRTLPNPQLLLRPLQDREALRSSSLEGTYASPEDLLLFDKQPREPKSEHDPANAWKEVSNYGTALREGVRLLGERPLSTQTIKAMHRKLLMGVRGKDKLPGEFRRDQVHIGSDRRYVPPPASHVNELMYDLQAYMNRADALDPLVRCFVVHYQFEAIHPFLDGNGRVGRALLAIMVQSLCGHHMPWLYMSAYFERYKDEYVDRLFNISATGDWESWIEFCLRGTTLQAGDSVARCDALKRLQDEFKQRVNYGKPRVHQVLEDLFTSPVVTKTELATRLGVTYKTAAGDIDYLVESGVLKQLSGSRHPRAYYAPDIFRIAYSDSSPRNDK